MLLDQEKHVVSQRLHLQESKHRNIMDPMDTHIDQYGVWLPKIIKKKQTQASSLIES